MISVPFIELSIHMTTFLSRRLNITSCMKLRIRTRRSVHPEHLSSLPVVSGVRVAHSLVLLRNGLQIIVCPFVLLLTIVLSVL
jgi:hypothetical protein